MAGFEKVWLCPNTFILPYPIAGYAPHMRALGRKAIWIGIQRNRGCAAT